MPIDAGHPNVEEHDVRAEFADGANGLDAIEGYGRSTIRTRILSSGTTN
jgi:hypothetical protein